MRESLSKKFCNCIKKVRKTVKARTRGKEEAAIAICTKSVLWSRGKTLRKFSCRGGPILKTQKR